ncbi:MAG: hypothetical protein HeimC3_08220 [Candidatus Heimdallarchaeota archaeon LC_3]|nr:MAG: hypothetical protein HeimC3_08220 [Candidatus Heimdallarchaeota archaeon LC_3]
MTDSNKINLLFIDENKENQEAFKNLISSQNLPYEYVMTDSIQEALKFTEGQKFDIIVTTAILKNGNASELLKIADTTPIIYITKEIEDLPIVIDKILKDDLHNTYIVSNEMLHKYKTIKSNIGLQDAIHGLIFHLSRLGPTLTYITKKDSTVISTNDAIRIGNFFYIAVGQGNERNIGLYELPVPGFSEFHSFVYAFEVLDPDNEDPRAQGKNYCMLAVIFPKWIREFLPHTSFINQVLNEILKIADTTPIIYITKEIEDLPIVIDKILKDDLHNTYIVSNEMLHKYKTIKSNIGLQDAIHGLIFHLSRLGPTLTYITKKDSTVISTNDAIRIGNFFYIAVGQGNERNIGLYELPVPGFSEFHSFVYAFEVLDPDNEDPRAQGKNYCMLAVIFPKWIREFLPHTSFINQVLNESFVQFQTLSEIKSGVIFDKLFKSILRIE